MPIKVLHIIPTLGRGGAERQLLNLVCNTRSAELEHVVCYLHPPGDFGEELQQTGLTVICLNLPNRWPFLFAPFRLIPKLKDLKPDIIQTWLYEADFSARFSTKRRSIPIINTLHLTSYEPETVAAAGWPRWKMAALRHVDRLSARWSRPLFVAVSETVRRSAIRQLNIPAPEIRVIYNSINQETLRSAPGDANNLRREFDLPSKGFVYVNVGRLAPQKGQRFLLEAFRVVAQDHDDVFLAFVGDGPLRDELQTLAEELGIIDRVRFLGSRQDIGACLEMGDAFVFPSSFEGLPLAPIEAMLKGLPCIATRIGPIEEFVTNRENGILVTHGSVTELVDAMREIYADPELRTRIAARARQLAFERFDSSIGMHSWKKLYREVALSKGNGLKP